MTIGAAMWIVTGASIAGTVANVYKRRWCFAVWLATNSAWCAYDASIGAWAQSALMLIYACLSVWGLVKWRKGGAT